MPSPIRGRAGYNRTPQSAGTRARRAGQGLITDSDLDNSTLERDGSGRARIKALDGLRQLPSTATLSQVLERVNKIQQMIQGL